MRVDHLTLVTLHAKARRERSEAVYRLLVAPVVRFLSSKPATAPLRSRLA